MDQHSLAASELLEEGEPAGWLVTYADLMTLLLTFFVLLFSISSLNLEKFKQAIAAIQVSLGEKAPAVELLELVLEPVRPTGRKIVLENLIGLKSRDISRDIRRFVYKRKLSDHIVVSTEGSKVIMRMTGKILFKSGSATLNPEAAPVLDDIVRIAKRYPAYDIRIEGHTDNLPISTQEFASNWELSAVRATTILRHMIDGGVDPHSLTATGYGALIPMVPNNTESNRARNRRVEFVLEKKTE